ncbi:NACHT domain- and WD repeat-containing protein 1 [Phlyctochytrium bullatum]|nr:NACHT domain- and WD repeat-containing protein 1 [Phlyctochytrium bullatum]
MGGITKTVEYIFNLLERTHGKVFVEKFFRVACLLRDGFSEIEMEDLMSTDVYVLSESCFAQMPFLKPSESPIPRVPTIVLVALLEDVTTTYEIMMRVGGRGKGPTLIKFSHPVIKETASRRYCAETEPLESTKTDICNYFSGAWVNDDEDVRESIASQSSKGPRISLCLKGGNSRGGDWKGVLNPFRYLAKQPTCISSADTAILYNYRKIRELPRALVFSQKWKVLQDIFEDFSFVEGLLRLLGIEQAINELNMLLAEGKKLTPGMPQSVQIYLKHLCVFLRYRLPWIAAHEATPGVHPDGLWLQEFRNLPTHFTGVFAVPIISCIEDTWTDLMVSRKGRIEYENGWRPDHETYCPMPFKHTNVQCCSISSDARYLVTGSSDGIVKVWELASGEEVRSFLHFQKTVQAVMEPGSLAPPPLVTNGPGSAQMPQRSGVTAVCFSNEKPANLVVSAAHDPKLEPSIKLWSWRSPSTAPRTLTGAHNQGSVIVAVDFLAPENRRLMSIGSDLNVVLWEVARGRIIRVVPVHLVDEVMEANGANAIMWRKSGANLPTIFKRRRLHPSGWPRLAGCVGPNGLFAFGASSVTVMDSRWKELLTKDLNSEKDKLRRQRLTASSFSPDGTVIFAASATPPDDVQMLTVELQSRVEMQLAMDEDTLRPPPLPTNSHHGPRRGGTRASTQIDPTGITHEAETEIRRLKFSTIRSWNIESGQQLLTFTIDDYINTIAVSPNGANILCAGAKAVVTMWDSTSGEHVLTREAHMAQITRVLWLPPQIKNVKPNKRKSIASQSESSAVDDLWTYGSLNHNTNSKSRSLSSLHHSPMYQFISVALDETLFAWSLDGIHAEPGLSHISTAVFNHTGDWLLTVGGAPLSSAPRGNTLVRLWETSTATVRCRIELPETQRTEVVWATFLPKDDTRIVVGCKNGLVKLYRSRSGELVREFWADPEMALSEAVLGYVCEWPFAATGTHIVAYAMHPEGRVIAVAAAGQERVPKPSATAENPKISHSLETAVQTSLDAAGLNEVAKLAAAAGRKSVTTETQIEADKSSDLVLRDCIRITFWDLDGNPLRMDNSFSLPIFFNASDASCCHGPGHTRPSLTKLSSFVMKWSHDGRSLFVSDDIEILKECNIEIRGSNVYGRPQSGWWWKSSASPPPSKMTAVDCLNPSVNTASIVNLTATVDNLDISRTLHVSAATACSSVAYRGLDHLVFAYGNGIIGWRKHDLQRGGEEVRWLLGHCASNNGCGGVVGCEYVPNLNGKASLGLQPKNNDLSGLIISASRNGTVLVQDCYSKEVCAAFNAGCPLKGMAVSPIAGRQGLGGSDRLRIVLCKADGTMAFLRYFA